MGPAASMLLAAVLAAFVTAFAAPVAGWAGRRFGWLDLPDGGRKGHGEPVPVTGGWAVVAGLSAALGLSGHWPAQLWGGGALIFALGWAEDVGRRRGRALPVIVRLVGQIVIAGWAMADLAPSPAAHAVLVGWTVALVNAANFIDGLDGLTAGVGAVAAAALAVIAGLSGGGSGGAPVAAALAGALVAVHVWSRVGRRLFLGDSGSMLAGYGLAAATAQLAVAHGPAQAAAGAVVCGVLVTEAVVTVVRRARQGTPVWQADADHLHHRLARTEGESSAVARILWFGAFFGCVGIASLALPGPWAIGGIALGVGAAGLLARDLYRQGV